MIPQSGKYSGSVHNGFFNYQIKQRNEVKFGRKFKGEVILILAKFLNRFFQITFLLSIILPNFL